MPRKFVLAFAFAAAAFAGSGAMGAETHVVTIYDNDFMPPLVFAQPGDTIRFINDDLVPREAIAADSSWTTGVIEPGGTFDLNVSTETQLLYASSNAYDGISENAGNVSGEILQDGAVTFEAPPLE